MDDDHREDGGFQRFFCYLNLFTFSMLMLVLGDNLLLMFLGWEGVGLCSYLLIGFWYSDRWNAYCGSKAFIVNRIGDFGFLLGIFLLFCGARAGGRADGRRSARSTAAFAAIAEQTVALPGWLRRPRAGGSRRSIGLCFFLGACGKSAQIPLYVWLPDAMAGPTPVSALIHAATMVTAGVYMVVPACRFLYAAAPGALGGDRLDRRAHGALRGDDRDRADRHQEGARVLDRVASSATCSWPRAAARYGARDLPPRRRTPSSRRCSSSARAR